MEHLLRATAQAEGRHFWFRGFRAFTLPFVRRAVGGRADAQILDCGCGTGANLEWLQRFGRATGFDLSATGLRLGREAGRSRLVQASVAAAPFRDGSFDLVTSFDVLYSLPDPDERLALFDMYRLLRPGGYALITVAAMESLRGDHSVLSREVRRYSRDLLRSRVLSAGFDIERLTYAFASLYLPMWAARAWQRRRGLRREDDRAAQHEIAVPPEPLNALLTALVHVESAWLRRLDLPFGSSLICLARKPLAPRS
ncbi:MAG TPA: class I SAM-dependent methyltransferase [Vicinamibacterales bacterium]|nr:class I SAM-dependent methyltransferase [Vicinamibacterales bacterium]